MNDLKRSAISGVLWVYASKYSGKVLVFISTLVLARLLIKEDFGVAGYALVVIAFMETLSGLGLKPALIYHEDTPAARDTAFYLGIGAALGLLLLTWVAAPFIADYFRDPRATAVSRVLALSLPIAALGNIHFALLEKHLNFKRKFIPDLTNAIAKGLISIVFAVAGFGAWSLIYGQLAGTVCSVIAVWIVRPWRPSLRFDTRMASSLLSYGTKIIVVGLLGFLVTNVAYFMVGRHMGAAVLGVYVLALRIPEVLIKEAAVSINKVLFPVFAKIKEDTATLGRGYLLIMRYLALMVVPLGLGLSAVSEPFVISLLTEKWADLIPVMRLAGIYMLLLALAFNAGTVFKAIGKPDLIIKLSVFRLILLVPSILWAVVVPASLVIVMWVQIGSIILHFLISLALVTRELKITMRRVLAAIWPAIACGGVMFLLVTLLIELLHNVNPFLQLALSFLAGTSVYCGLLWWWQRNVLQQGFEQIRTAMASRR